MSNQKEISFFQKKKRKRNAPAAERKREIKKEPYLEMED
jgi:hypothetical protein